MIDAPYMPGLAPDHADKLAGLLQRVQDKAARNRLRTIYYDYRNALRDLGIAIPPHMRTVDVAIGVPAKAVDAMSRRTVLEEFVLLSGGSTADLGLDAILKASRFKTIAPQTHTSALVHSTAFSFVTAGDVAAGEPEVMLSTRSAERATGTWNHRIGGLDSALSIVSTDAETGQPDHMVMYLPNLAIIMRKDGNKWDIRQSQHDLGVPVEQFPYRATLDRPFGRSRISRPVMALTDSMMRTLLRTEVGAEFFNAPQRYVLGADDGAFVDRDGNPTTSWQVIIGHLLTLSRDEDNELPQVGEFRQQSMEPNVAHYRMLAQVVASETSLPLRSLGVVGDNPESADAIKEANIELELEIKHWETTSLGPAWERQMVRALRMVDDSPAARAEYATLEAKFLPPGNVSEIARADSFAKTAPFIEGFAESEVGLEFAGLSPQQIARFAEDRRRANARSTAADMIAAAQRRTPAVVGGNPV